jgi:hypothetical protein
MDGSPGHGSAAWKAFARARVAALHSLVGAGYDVVMADVDVVFLREPCDYVQCASDAEACPLMAGADVMVSSDSLSPALDASRGARHAAGGVFNTGLIAVRATKGVRTRQRTRTPACLLSLLFLRSL